MSDAFLELAPDFAEPLEHWRVWRLVDADGRLSLGSIIKPTLWPAGRPLVADCLHRSSFAWWRRRRQPHDAPEEKCECGIYATKLERLGPYLVEPLPHDAVARVLGKVALWGTVVECERGFRASHAYPVELYVPMDASRDRRVGAEELVQRLADYDVRIDLLDARGREAPAVLEAARISGSV